MPGSRVGVGAVTPVAMVAAHWTPVEVGARQMPCSSKPDAGRLAPGIPPSNFWASDPNGIDEVGCVHFGEPTTGWSLVPGD
jgi:hypothetical protein